MQNKILPVQYERDIVQKIVHLNTKYRDNYFTTNSTDFKYNFPLAINNILSMRLRSSDIPNTWYTFSEKLGNNRFIIETVCGKEKNHSIFEIVIPDGNYNAIQFQNLLNGTYLHQSGVSNELNYLKFTISEIDLKSRFHIIGKYPSNFSYTLKFSLPGMRHIMDTTGWLLGFRMSQYTNLTTDFASEGLFDAGGDRYIYVSLEDFNKSRNDNNIIFLDNTFIDKDIIGKMYLHDGKFNININDNDGSANLKKRVYMGPVDIKTIKIKILDQYGNLVHLNNMDWSFALEFEILYRKYQKNYTR